MACSFQTSEKPHRRELVRARGVINLKQVKGLFRPYSCVIDYVTEVVSGMQTCIFVGKCGVYRVPSSNYSHQIFFLHLYRRLHHFFLIHLFSYSGMKKSMIFAENQNKLSFRSARNAPCTTRYYTNGEGYLKSVRLWRSSRTFGKEFSKGDGCVFLCACL